MSWTIIKDLKEKRAKAFADAGVIRTTANTENRDLTADEQTRHDALMKDVENFAVRIGREEKAGQLAESFGTDSRSQVGRDGNSLDMPDKDFSRYSVLRAIAKRVDNQPLDGVEAEVNVEMEKRAGKKAAGFYMPLDSAQKRTGVDNLTTGTGAVGVTLLPSVIELLRNKMLVVKLGARLMTDLNGKFSLPRQSGGGTAYWVAESGAPTASNQTIDQVAFVPKTVGAFTDLSRQFINQTSIDAEAFARDDLATIIALELDRAAIAGSGSSNQPTGILSTSGIGDVALGTNGLSAITYSNVVALETAVANANADIGKMSYLTNTKVRGLLKTTDKTTGGFGQFLWADDEVNGYSAAASNNVPSNLTKGTSSGDCSALIFGNWDDLIIAQWGGLDVLVDPYTGGTSGTIRIRVLQETDIELRHAASFAACKDIITG